MSRQGNTLKNHESLLEAFDRLVYQHELATGGFANEIHRHLIISNPTPPGITANVVLYARNNFM